MRIRGSGLSRPVLTQITSLGGMTANQFAGLGEVPGLRKSARQLSHSFLAAGAPLRGNDRNLGGSLAGSVVLEDRFVLGLCQDLFHHPLSVIIRYPFRPAGPDRIDDGLVRLVVVPHITTLPSRRAGVRGFDYEPWPCSTKRISASVGRAQSQKLMRPEHREAAVRAVLEDGNTLAVVAGEEGGAARWSSVIVCQAVATAAASSGQLIYSPCCIDMDDEVAAEAAWKGDKVRAVRGNWAFGHFRPADSGRRSIRATSSRAGRQGSTSPADPSVTAHGSLKIPSPHRHPHRA